VGHAAPSLAEGSTGMLTVGDKAPDFSLPSESGEKIHRKDFLGKTLVLYFFPKADTPG
jgi:peroxiredoxin Q/BCP